MNHPFGWVGHQRIIGPVIEFRSLPDGLRMNICYDVSSPSDKMIAMYRQCWLAVAADKVASSNRSPRILGWQRLSLQPTGSTRRAWKTERLLTSRIETYESMAACQDCIHNKIRSVVTGHRATVRNRHSCVMASKPSDSQAKSTRHDVLAPMYFLPTWYVGRGLEIHGLSSRLQK